MKTLKEFQVWFVVGSQHLYGPKTLKQVAENARKIAKGLDDSGQLPCQFVFKAVVTTPQEILTICQQANTAPNCVGLVFWMHTFSPAKMWIAGLNALQKPFAHLHTQFNRDIPWDTIDMDFMNLNQSAHGDREFGFICSRLRKNRKVIVGHWQDPDVARKLDVWMRAACGWREMQTMKIARFGDNMRQVAVTEGDKVEAQKQFGFSVDGFGVGDLAAMVDAVSNAEIEKLVKTYQKQYQFNVAPKHLKTIRNAAKIEIGLRRFLQSGGYQAFTTTFEDLHGLPQLPGLAVQRLMGDGYGFGAEGDWKTAALVRAMKVMAAGLSGGTSFMEDYTYHFDPMGMKVLGAHMLEVCPSVADGVPSLEVHPLSIGGKPAPARLVFSAVAGEGVNASLIDMGNRFRLLVNPVEVVAPDQPMPKLPVARILWQPKPDLKSAAAAWILAGGAHHTGFSMALTTEHLIDFAEMAGIEYLVIDDKTDIETFKMQLRSNEVYFWMNKGL